MACTHCGGNPTKRSTTWGGHLDHTPRERDRLSLVICESCGYVLRPRLGGDPMLEKLSQLARFGLSECVLAAPESEP